MYSRAVRAGETRGAFSIRGKVRCVWRSSSGGRCEGRSMQVGTGREGGGAEKELAEETRSPSQQGSPDGRQRG